MHSNETSIRGRVGIGGIKPAQLLCSRKDVSSLPSLKVAAEELMAATEALVSCLQAAIPIASGHQRHIVRQLGRSSVVLEAVMSVRRLLRPHGHVTKWWRKLLATIPTDYKVKEALLTADPQRKFHCKLVKRLLATIEIYKTGGRPHPSEVLQLKRMLFCSKLITIYFRSSPWRAWRMDDEEFRAIVSVPPTAAVEM
ncbi:hypothetical protein Efla_002431 [Eimeria flavescens]